jgi:hypothetical protein
MVHQLGSFVEGFGDPMTQTSIPNSVEEVVAEVMKANKVAELFQTMVIVGMNMIIIGIWTFLRWMWLTPINLQMFVHEELLNFTNVHYYKSWLFKRFNLITLSI